ncbi:MAG: hypothetical protein K0U38_05475 [Epsilonproteobacteria bacterium]|nr:hypothetical protein [Campylobacterota bacterium]
MGSKLIMLFGLVIGAILIFFCIQKHKEVLIVEYNVSKPLEVKQSVENLRVQTPPTILNNTVSATSHDEKPMLNISTKNAELLYGYVLLAITLLFSFLIGWGLRRWSYRAKYEALIDSLEYEDEQSLKKLHKNERTLESSKSQYLDNKDSLRIKTERLESYIERDSYIEEINESFKNSNHSIMEKIELTDKNIDKALEELSKIREASTALLEQKKEISEAEVKVHDVLEEHEVLERLITSLKAKSRSLNSELKKIEKDISSQEEKIYQVEENINHTQQQYNEKRATIIDELEESETMANNYELALQYIEQKEKSGEEISFETVSEIIHKNEKGAFLLNLKRRLLQERKRGSRWFDKVKHLYNKNIQKVKREE